MQVLIPLYKTYLGIDVVNSELHCLLLLGVDNIQPYCLAVTLLLWNGVVFGGVSPVVIVPVLSTQRISTASMPLVTSSS